MMIKIRRFFTLPILAKRAFIDNALLLSILINQVSFNFAKKSTMIKYLFFLLPFASLGQTLAPGNIATVKKDSAYEAKMKSIDYLKFSKYQFDESMGCFTLSVEAQNSRKIFLFHQDNDSIPVAIVPSSSSVGWFTIQGDCFSALEIQYRKSDDSYVVILRQDFDFCTRPLRGCVFRARHQIDNIYNVVLMLGAKR